MAYRTNNISPTPPQRVFDVRNGATLKVAFGCFYYRSHDSKLHDHVGWPQPGSPDDICQERIIDPAPWLPYRITLEDGNVEPIHLSEEGYQDVAIAIEDPDVASASTIQAQIDQDEDHLIRMQITVNMPTFSDKPKETGFTVFAIKADGFTRDAVCHGKIKVLPGSSYSA
jgi:hypothetical protein